MRIDRHDRKRCRLSRLHHVRQIDPVVRQVCAQLVTKEVVRQARGQAHRHSQAGKPDGDIGRTAAWYGFEQAILLGWYKVDQGFADDGDASRRTILSHLAENSSPAMAPVMIATASDIEKLFGSITATRRPRR